MLFLCQRERRGVCEDTLDDGEVFRVVEESRTTTPALAADWEACRGNKKPILLYINLPGKFLREPVQESGPPWVVATREYLPPILCLDS